MNGPASQLPWPEDLAACWRLTVDGAEGKRKKSFSAFVTAAAQLNRPSIPDIPGRGTFRRPAFGQKLRGQLAPAVVDPGSPPTERAVSAANDAMREAPTVPLPAQIQDAPWLEEVVGPRHPPASKRIIRDDATGGCERSPPSHGGTGVRVVDGVIKMSNANAASYQTLSFP